MIEHRVDAAALQEPELTDAMTSGKFKFLGQPYDSISPNFCFGGIVANDDWAAKNPGALKEFVRVTFEAAAYVNAHHSETVQMMADVTKLPVEKISKMARVENATSNDPQLIQPLIDAGAKYKMTARSFPAKELFG
jgi:ABC-type nitrate/sulfonate/bicarbonate transport system substrate-binding protein